MVDYFLEDDCAMLTLSDSENESDDEEIPDLGKNVTCVNNKRVQVKACCKLANVSGG